MKTKTLKEWMRMTDAKYEEHLDRMRDALMDKWRGRAYYRCFACRQTGYGGIRKFHIVKTYDMHDTNKITLEPMCNDCYLMVMLNGENEVE